MEVFEAIKMRRSVRRYEKEKVPREKVEKILEAAKWAPSASNSQPWNFIILEDEGTRKEIAEATTYGKFLADAPCGIAVAIDPSMSNHPIEDGAIATQNMLLAAHALGLGACWIGSYGSTYEVRVKEILKIPREKRLLSIVSLGYPDEFSKSTRKKLEELVFTDRYG